MKIISFCIDKCVLKNRILELNKIKKIIKDNESKIISFFTKNKYKIEIKKNKKENVFVYSEKRCSIIELDKEILKIIKNGYKIIEKEDENFLIVLEKYNKKWIAKIKSKNRENIIINKNGGLDFNGRLTLGFHDSIEDIIKSIKILLID